MSLVLAGTMALSLMTVASAADTKVYYADGKVAANGTIRLEIKDAEGNFVKAVTREKALGTSSASFGAAFNIKAGQSVTASIDGGIVGSATIE